MNGGLKILVFFFSCFHLMHCASDEVSYIVSALAHKHENSILYCYILQQATLSVCIQSGGLLDTTTIL